MRWKDEGIILATRKHGEYSIIVSLFTKHYGQRKGLLKDNAKYYKFQIGDHVNATWSSRSLSNLGYFKYELISSPLYYYFYDSMKIIIVSMITSILEKVLPENDPQIIIYELFLDFIASLELEDENQMWKKKYIAFELHLLKHLGFALDLSKCVVSHAKQDLHFISPKTGKAVSKNSGEKYIKNLLPLPEFLYNIYNNNYSNCYSNQEFKLSLKVLGYFLEKHLLSNFNTEIFKHRKILMDQLKR